MNEWQRDLFLKSEQRRIILVTQNNTWSRGGMEFLFSCLTWYLTRSLHSLVRYHSNRNFIPPRSHVWLYIWFIGVNRRTLIEENIVKPVGLVVYMDYVYWIDKDTSNVVKVKKYNDSSREPVQEYVDDLSDIAVVDITTSTGKINTGHLVFLFCFFSFCTEVQGWYANGTLSPMRGISPSLHPPMPRDS